jgi:hypothetical protein
MSSQQSSEVFAGPLDEPFLAAAGGAGAKGVLSVLSIRVR